jgi:phage FluMu protein Com
MGRRIDLKLYTLQLLKQCPTCKGTGKQQVSCNYIDDETYGVEVESSKYMQVSCFDCKELGPNEVIWEEGITFDQLSKGIVLKINFENLLTNENGCGKMVVSSKKKGEGK